MAASENQSPPSPPPSPGSETEEAPPLRTWRLEVWLPAWAPGHPTAHPVLLLPWRAGGGGGGGRCAKRLIQNSC